MVRTCWIVGTGRMGLAIGSVVAEAGAVQDLLFVGRRDRAPDHSVMSLPPARYAPGFPDPPPAGTLVLLAVPDGAIRDTAMAIAALGAPGPGCVALHLSGALPAEALGRLAERGYAVGGLHPLQTVADPARGAERLRGAYFTFEGDPSARAAAAEIVEAAAGRMLEVHATEKARYHAACVFASNYVVVCVAVATRLLATAANIAEAEAGRALQPLWGGAVSNLDRLGPTEALTGPVRRGDVDTVRAHLDALDGAELELYAELALETLRVARRAGVSAEIAKLIETEILKTRGGGSGHR